MMYGKVFYMSGGKIEIKGDDGKIYTPTLDSIGLLDKYIEDCYVSFKPGILHDGSRAAQIYHIISPRVIDKARVGQCVTYWDQEATRDRGVFIHTNAFREIASDRKCFIVGRKGVGKSAVVKALIDEQYVGGVFSPEHFPFDQMHKLAESSSVFTLSRYKPIWVILYISLAISFLATNKGVSQDLKKKIFSAGKDKSGVLPGFLEKIKEFSGNPCFDSIGDVAAMGLAAIGLPPVNPIKMVGAPISILVDIFSRAESVGVADKTLRDIEEGLIEYYIGLGDKPVVLIAFDQLDEEYKEKNIEEYPKLIESLFSASSWVLDKMSGMDSKAGLAIKPIVILRDDIFDTQFDTNNRAKYLSYVVRPEWDKNSLQQVIQARLLQAANNGDQDRQFEDLWLDVFLPFFPGNPDAIGSDLRKGKLKYYSSYECFIRHTSRTPRDVIELLKEVLISLGGENSEAKSRCDYFIFIEARRRFSEYYALQVVDGVQTAFLNIRGVLDIIEDTCQSTTISRDKLTEAIKDLVVTEEHKESVQINDLYTSLSSSQDPDVHKIIVDRIKFLNSKVDGRVDGQIRKLLKLLWDVCAIGLLLNQRVYRAKYLGSEDFSIKPGEQIAFHPSLAVYLKMDVSVMGLPYQEFDIEGDNDSWQQEVQIKPKYSTLALRDLSQRNVIRRELDGVKWKMKFLSKIPSGIFLSHPEFPNNVFCQTKVVRDFRVIIGDGDEVSVDVSIVCNNENWSYVVRRFYK